MGTPAMSILIKAFCFNCDFSKQPNQPICRNNTDPYNTDGEHFSTEQITFFDTSLRICQ